MSLPRRMTVLALAILAASFAGAGDGDSLPAFASREARLRALVGPEIERAAGEWAGASRPSRILTSNQKLYDVTSYDLDLVLDDVTQTVFGTVTMEARSLSASGLTVIDLDLMEAMVVDDVAVGGGPAPAWTHASDLLTVTLDRDYAKGETFRVATTYHGYAPTGLHFTRRGSGTWVVWSYVETSRARAFWPCKDDPSDKADRVTLHWTVPKPLIAVSNGVLESTTDRGSHATYHWTENHPIATYLVAVAATDYILWSETYTSLDGKVSMPVHYYCYPEELASCLLSWEGFLAKLQIMAELFGEYPYLDEKLAMAMYPNLLSMEHTTLISYSEEATDGTHNNDPVIVHEIAHQWWGDCVTPATWDDFWFKEALASHAEGLWAEREGGDAAYRAAMKAMWQVYDASSGPLYANPTVPSPIHYEKGAWVQHMLRHVLGDDALFGALRDWAATMAHASATTADYQAALEGRYGSSLDWFFQEWVYGVGMPSFEVLRSWAPLPAPLGGGTRIFLRVKQLQSDAPPFLMPVDVRITTASGSETRVVWVYGTSRTLTMDVGENVTGVEFDPDEWVYRELRYSDWPDADRDGVPDEFDCAPGEGLAAFGPGEVRNLRVAGGTVATLTWDPEPLSTSYDITRGSLESLGPGQYGPCVATGILVPTFEDPEPPVPGGFFYLVSGHAAICKGPLGFDSGGAQIVNTDPQACP